MKKTKQSHLQTAPTDLRREQFMRVLVVDDDSTTAESHSMLLMTCGFETHVCLRGADAMEMIERLLPQAVLLNLEMPEMDGFVIAEELRQNPDLRPHLLIANAGYDDESIRAKTLAAGFNHHLLKPIQWDVLRTIMRDCESTLTASLVQTNSVDHIKPR